MTPIEDLEITNVQMTADGFIISWSANIGFGSVWFHRENGKWYADTECMSKDFCKLVFDKFLEGVEIEV